LLLVAQSQNGARTNLAENDSVSQKDGKSTSFHKEHGQQLSSRTIYPELLEANKIIAEKDGVIESLTKENEELLKQHNLSSHGKSINIQQQTQLELESELSKKDTIIKELKIQIDGLIEQQLEAIKSNNSNEKSVSPSLNDQHGNSIIDFEMSLPFEEVRIHMESMFKKNKDLGKVSFHGRLNLKTGKVVAASIGNITEEDFVKYDVV
jgi:hypothetical protein